MIDSMSRNESMQLFEKWVEDFCGRLYREDYDLSKKTDANGSEYYSDYRTYALYMAHQGGFKDGIKHKTNSATLEE